MQFIRLTLHYYNRNDRHDQGEHHDHYDHFHDHKKQEGNMLEVWEKLKEM